MRLIKATRQELPGVREMLLELGNGENGFTGADFGCGRMTLEEQLLFLEEMSEGMNLKPEWVPMTTFWFVNDENEPIGMSRLRHELNDWLLSHGGHIGYHIRASQRRKGYGILLLRPGMRCSVARKDLTQSFCTAGSSVMPWKKHSSNSAENSEGFSCAAR